MLTKKIVLVGLVLIVFSLVFARIIGQEQSEILLPEFDRLPEEPTGYDPDKIAQTGMEDYAMEVADRIIEFLHTLPTVSIPENKKELLGTWILQNEIGTAVDGNSRRYEIEKIFDILL